MTESEIINIINTKGAFMALNVKEQENVIMEILKPNTKGLYLGTFVDKKGNTESLLNVTDIPEMIDVFADDRAKIVFVTFEEMENIRQLVISGKKEELTEDQKLIYDSISKFIIRNGNKQENADTFPGFPGGHLSLERQKKYIDNVTKDTVSPSDLTFTAFYSVFVSILENPNSSYGKCIRKHGAELAIRQIQEKMLQIVKSMSELMQEKMIGREEAALCMLFWAANNLAVSNNELDKKYDNNKFMKIIMKEISELSDDDDFKNRFQIMESLISDGDNDEPNGSNVNNGSNNKSIRDLLME